MIDGLMSLSAVVAFVEGYLRKLFENFVSYENAKSMTAC
jgi:hypothetical protein